MTDVCHLDIETYSEVDLKKSGLYRYAEDETTEVTVACFAFDDGPVQYWFPDRAAHVLADQLPGQVHLGPCPKDLAAHIDAGRPVHAHNAQFERVVLNGPAGRRLGVPKIAIRQTVCTAAKVATAGLPRNLGEAAAALGTHPKDDIGKMAMYALSKPRTGKTKRWDFSTPKGRELYLTLARYCGDDVEAERGIDKAVRNLPLLEQQVYWLDQLINERGVGVDLESVHTVQRLVAEYRDELQKACVTLTGLSPSQTGKLADWIRAHGYPRLSDLQKDTVLRALEDPACPTGLRGILKLFSTYNAKAVNKFDAIDRAVCADGRLHGMFLYYGAGTGRWSSLIVQLQNLFRPVIENANDAIDVFALDDLQYVKESYPGVDPMKVFASTVRGMLVPAEGKHFIALDFAGIEARVNAWLFGEEWKLAAFRAFDAGTGPDLYKVAYSRSFARPIEGVTKDERQVGKVQELALGYEGGVGAFVTMAATYNLDIEKLAAAALNAMPAETLEYEQMVAWPNAKQSGRSGGLARETWVGIDGIKTLWRASHPKIRQGWRDLKDGAAHAIRNPGRTYKLPNGKIKFKMHEQWLYMRLPSGRLLAYFRPWVEGEDWDETIRFMGVNTETRQWGKTHTYGGKLCENAVQAISRDLLVGAMLRLEEAGYTIVGTVHDEVILEVPVLFGSQHRAEQIMCELPDWAAGLPIAVEGWTGPRYKK